MTGTIRPPSRDMTSLDHLLYKGDEHTAARSTMMAILLLESAPDLARLRRSLERASRVHHRLRERVVAPLIPLGPPRWLGDPDFDLDYHLRRVAAPAPATMTELLAMASPIAMAPLDRRRPLWEATLVEGLEGGRAALLVKAHHALTDGIGGIEMLAAMLELTPDPEPVMPVAPAPHDVTPTELAVHRLKSIPADAIRVAAGLVPLVRRTGTALVNPSRTVAEASHAVSSVRRMFEGPGVPPSPLLRRRSLARRIAVLERPLAELKAAGKLVDGTVNVAYLAALGGALRAYHHAMGLPVDAVPAAIPVSFRAADPSANNQWSGVQVALAVEPADPLQRLRRVRTDMAASIEGAVDARLLGTLSSVMSMMPGVMLARMAEGASSVDVQASNIPGIDATLYLAGSELAGIYGCGPLPGQAMMAVLVSYRGSCSITVNYDTAAIQDPQLFERCLVIGFDEICALGAASHPTAARPPRPGRRSPKGAR